ncbi:type IV pilus assembly protein PilM [Cellulomonas sp. P24]|uniref:type IV pilus assembly protein PilM n=1 Tax=Cellulomonas sp. P24 TaxID=2885206 RepID=UPI00216B0526|nr:type IV pilus assembly protein PilM [Cellulomonas sp. P24]MCR6494604.1 type IV pilus assembly protein PilM [Cellulomonas sp. P24]
MSKTRVIGLDIGTTHVRAAEVEFGSGGPAGKGVPELVRFGQIPLPSGAVRDGEVAEPQTVASALRQLWAQNKFGSKDVIIGVGNQRVLVRDLDLPAMPLPELRTSLAFQVQDLIPVAVDDALLDYYPSSTADGPHGPVYRGLLVAATKETVKANTAAVELAGLRPMMVDLNAFALARVQARGDLSEGTIALVDIGARVTNVVIVASGRPRFVRILPSGGQDVTDAVAHALNIPIEQAEGLKREIGVGYAVVPELEPAKEAINDVTGSLIEAIRNTLVYYASSNPGGAVTQVYISGGGTFLPGLGQFLSSASRVPVALGQPLSTLRVASSAAGLSEVQSVLAVSVGLAFGVAA